MSNHSSSVVLFMGRGGDVEAQVLQWLAAEGFGTKPVRSGPDALEEALAGDYAAVIVGIEGEEEHARVGLLRQAGYLRPILGIAETPLAREDDHFDRILDAPLEKSGLLSALLEELGPTLNRPADGLQQKLEASPLFLRLRHSFLLGLADSVEQIEIAFGLRDWQNAVHLVHALKGTAGSFGFSELADSSKRIENLLRAGEHAGAQAGLGQLRQNADFLLR